MTAEDPTPDVLGLLRALSVVGHPGDAAAHVVEALCRWGATGAAVYLVDYGHDTLVALAEAGEHFGRDSSAGPYPMEGTMVGRCFSTDLPVTLATDDVVQRWFPVGVRADRVGVLEMAHRASDSALGAVAADVALVLGFALADAERYTDKFNQARRRHPMALSAAMQWSLLPPQDFAVPEVSVSGQLEPAYDVGGDAYDYALNGDTLFLAVLDGMGHGVEASLLATAALNAYRHGRRTDQEVADVREEMDHVVGSFFRKSVFVTGLLAQLDIHTGRFTWVNAGHPPPLLLRGRRVVATLECSPALPFGLGPVTTESCEERLEPGDSVLIYTDGVVDARSVDSGEVFGEEGLRDFLEREAAAGQLNGETLRRLTASLSARARGQLGDDATVLLIEWHGAEPDGSHPQDLGLEGFESHGVIAEGRRKGRTYHRSTASDKEHGES